MKKISLCLLAIICLVLTGCGSKETREVKTLEDFKVAATNSGFTVTDRLSYYQSDNIDYITGSYLATLDDMEIEMVTYDSVESAKKTIQKHLKVFQTMKSPSMTGSKEKGANFEKHVVISNGYYLVTSRIDDTLIFSKTLLKNKESIEKILSDLGY